LVITSKQSHEAGPGKGLSRRDCLDFELLDLVGTDPGLSQRDIARRLGISLGSVNSRLKTLCEAGAIRSCGTQSSGKGSRPAYDLTEAGRAVRSRMQSRVLQHKLEELDRLKAQIEILRRGLVQRGGGACG
jgi:MarR family transcriptional regulator, temperature-dependent positive regulator of motility